MFRNTSKEIWRFIALLLTTIMLFSTLQLNYHPLLSLAAGSERSIKIGSCQIAPGETAVVAITGENIPSPGLAGYQISIQYDSQKIEVIGLEKSASDSFSLQIPNFDVPGIVKLTAIQTTGVTGEIILARLRIKAKELAVGSTDLKLTTEELVLEDLKPLQVQVTNGHVDILNSSPLEKKYETARLSGYIATQTAVKIAKEATKEIGWTGTAILASSNGMVDALTAGPLASYLKAPILLTGAGALDADTKAALTELAVKTVYVTSGTAVISQAVLNELTDMNITIVPLGGIDRFETSVNIAKKMVGVTKVAVANSLQDALSIASIASAQNQPILLTEKDVMPASVKAFLATNTNIKRTNVIGGTGVISDSVMAQLPNATRHAGITAYDTNSEVIQDFNAFVKYDHVYLANGETAIDALAGAPLAAQSKAVIVLTNQVVPKAVTFVKGKLTNDSIVTALGGTAAVPDAVLEGFATE